MTTLNECFISYKLCRKSFGLVHLRSQASSFVILEPNSEPYPYEQTTRRSCPEFSRSYISITFENIPHLVQINNFTTAQKIMSRESKMAA